MNIQINSCKLTIELTDTETGEIITREATLGDFKEKKTTTRTRKPKGDDEPEPMIHVLEGKLQLNQKARELTEYEPDMKIDIKFEKKGRAMTPIMCIDENKGNRLTKSYTISCRGQKRENLLEYGDTFTIEPYPDKEGMFKLTGNIPPKEDDIIDVPEEIESPDENLAEEENIDLDNLDFTF